MDTKKSASIAIMLASATGLLINAKQYHDYKPVFDVSKQIEAALEKGGMTYKTVTDPALKPSAAQVASSSIIKHQLMVSTIIYLVALTGSAYCVFKK